MTKDIFFAYLLSFIVVCAFLSLPILNVIHNYNASINPEQQKHCLEILEEYPEYAYLFKDALKTNNTINYSEYEKITKFVMEDVFRKRIEQ